MGDKPEPGILTFTARTRRDNGEPTDGDEAGELVAAGNAYAVARGTRSPPALRFLLRDGRSFAMPYAYHPIVWGESAALVLLEYPRCFTVILAGKNLGLVEAQLCERRVTWIRECGDADADRLSVAVTRIERLHRYPSRESDST